MNKYPVKIPTITLAIFVLYATLVCHSTVLFLDCKIHLCDFHYEKAWNEWLARTEHSLSGCKDEIQWNPINTTTVRPKYFGRNNGVVVLTGVGIKLQHTCFLMTSCKTVVYKYIN